MGASTHRAIILPTGAQTFIFVSACLHRTAAATSSAHVCKVPNYSNEDLRVVIATNCERVKATAHEFEKAILRKDVHEDQNKVWVQRNLKALNACKEAKHQLQSNDVRLAADYAINAWGTHMMAGAECCSMLGPPYCVSTSWTGSGAAMLLLLFTLASLFLASAVGSFCLRTKAAAPERKRGHSDVCPSTEGSISQPGQSLQGELQQYWMQRSCLRVLPGALAVAKPSASLFSALTKTFDFQSDNARNQYEHLLSLWRSNCASVADRAKGEPLKNEDHLLSEALGDLYADLLDGFTRWRDKFRKHRTDMNRSHMPYLGGVGASWQQIHGIRCTGEDTPEELSVKLAEISMYLLVWGEAGNLRFMPELVYFITELAMASEVAGPNGFYGGVQAGSSTAAPFQSRLFLSQVVRPIYNAVFDEWYQHVHVASNQKDLKKLHDGFDAYLPPDVCNYDDWNELFCDPERLANNLRLQDGSRLFDLPHSQRFKSLHAVDWHKSFEASAAKTHREVHSLWGVYATTHRIWLLHAVLFLFAACSVSPDPHSPPDGNVPLAGQTFTMRLASVGLLVPIQTLLVSFATWNVTGEAVRIHRRGVQLAIACMKIVCSFLPVVTYCFLRTDFKSDALPKQFVLVVHYVLSGLGLSLLLFRPAHEHNLWKPTKVPLHQRAVRYIFWAAVLAVKVYMAMFIVKAVISLLEDLDVVMVGRESVTEIESYFLSAKWAHDFLLWQLIWATTFLLFVTDTQLWFTIGCSILGASTVIVQRRGKFWSYLFEDAVSKIPERFSRKVLTYSPKDHNKQWLSFSAHFPQIWDQVVQHMRYEDKVDDQTMGDLSFGNVHHVSWKHGHVEKKPAEDSGVAEAGELAKPRPSIQRGKGSMVVDQTKRTVPVPLIFRPVTQCEATIKNFCGMADQHWPQNGDVQWRLTALARGLGLPMPRPYRAPYFPGLTVIIPHYGESILMVKDELFKEGRNDIVPLMNWLKNRYDSEFTAFTSRQAAIDGWIARGSQWDAYSSDQWDKICKWASMRMQTLWRTVAGMCLYHPAIQCHYEVQADTSSALAHPDVWNPSDCFTCLVSMQMYKFFDKTMLAHTNRMFDKFPDCLKVAFIDCEDKGECGDVDEVHRHQHRRYFSCLIDGSSTLLGDGRREPKYRVELPGFPILGDGKGDNQNHAIIFARGTFSQCIDANQGAYFEQMLLLPVALAEFRSHVRGDGGGKRIIGFPEHITSDIGSVGHMAASAELAFGTILQRTYAVLGARMHYGHPDLMNKLYMIQQGGVSKATKTLNLSEDIFAGMDFTLRGEGRSIRHCEYFHLAKGRDLGFNTVLGFFSKLSSGAGEQIITRQMYRLGQVLHLPECLSFYYAHVGYYFTQFFVSCSMPLLVLFWQLVLLSDCEGTWDTFHKCETDLPASEVMARTLSIWFSWLLLLFLIATSLPYFIEVCMELGLRNALKSFMKQMLTLSPLLFIFQAKIIGNYVTNEIRRGGATYVATGRGLPTERRPFIGEVAEGSLQLKRAGGLYLDYATHTYYDGVRLLLGGLLIIVAGGISEPAPPDEIQKGETGSYVGQLGWMWLSLGLTIASWLYAPFIFNPYQFVAQHFWTDLRAWVAFFLESNGKHWADWHDKTHLKGHSGLSQLFADIGFFFAMFFLAVWYATVNFKVGLLASIYSEYPIFAYLTHWATLLPPMFCSLAYCAVVILLEARGGVPRCCSAGRTPEPSADAELGAAGAPDSDEQPAAGGDRLCTRAPHLATSAVIVGALDLTEMLLMTRVLCSIGWMKVFFASLVLKYTVLSSCIYLGEGFIRSRLFKKTSSFSTMMQLWVRTHRMIRDMVTSSIILLGLAPAVIFNRINEILCSGFSLHQLLVYRDPGHLTRSEAEVIDVLPTSLTYPCTTPPAGTVSYGLPREDVPLAADTQEKSSRGRAPQVAFAEGCVNEDAPEDEPMERSHSRKDVRRRTNSGTYAAVRDVEIEITDPVDSQRYGSPALSETTQGTYFLQDTGLQHSAGVLEGAYALPPVVADQSSAGETEYNASRVSSMPPTENTALVSSPPVCSEPDYPSGKKKKRNPDPEPVSSHSV